MSRREGRWPRAYRPLRPASLLAQLVFVVAAELALYSSYAAHEARFHWATHFLVALLVTALWQSVHLLVAARPARGQLATVVVFHLWAMWPDLLFRGGVPHYHWMDWLALGHVSSHYLPGGDTSWLVLALLGAGGYAVLLTRWVMARSTEAAAGLPPALGVGGAGVLRPQADPRTEPLAHEHVTPGPSTDVAPVLLLHGLGATSATWLPAGRVLAAAGHDVISRICSASAPRCASARGSVSSTRSTPCCVCSTTTGSTGSTSAPTAGAVSSPAPWPSALLAA